MGVEGFPRARRSREPYARRSVFVSSGADEGPPGSFEALMVAHKGTEEERLIPEEFVDVSSLCEVVATEYKVRTLSSFAISTEGKEPVGG